MSISCKEILKGKKLWLILGCLTVIISLEFFLQINGLLIYATGVILVRKMLSMAVLIDSFESGKNHWLLLKIREREMVCFRFYILKIIGWVITLGKIPGNLLNVLRYKTRKVCWNIPAKDNIWVFKCIQF